MMVTRLIHKHSQKAGLPPGTLVHIGEHRTEPPRITVIDYDGVHYQRFETEDVEKCFPFKDTPTVTWINVDGIHNAELIEKLGDCFHLHPLILEDIVNTDQRSKLEDYDDYLFLVLKMLDYDGKAKQVRAEQVSIVLGRNYVISFQETEGDVFDPIRERIRKGKGKIRKLGADYLAYGLIDVIVDNYFTIIEKIGERVDDLEDVLVERPTQETVKEIHRLRRELLFLRKSIWPLREILGGMGRDESPLIRTGTTIYLRDVHDHTIQIIDTMETYRDMLAGMLDIYLSSMSNRMNEIMKVLTMIATIFIPLTFIAGIYGMNFEFMPELKWHYGYPAVLCGMLVIVVLMLFYFRRKKWL